jgi:hypothetical protein
VNDPFTPETARIIGQLLLIVFLLGLLFLGGVVVLTLGLSSHRGAREQPEREPGEFKHLDYSSAGGLPVPAETHPPEIRSPEKKAS